MQVDVDVRWTLEFYLAQMFTLTSQSVAQNTHKNIQIYVLRQTTTQK